MLVWLDKRCTPLCTDATVYRHHAGQHTLVQLTRQRRQLAFHLVQRSPPGGTAGLQKPITSCPTCHASPSMSTKMTRLGTAFFCCTAILNKNTAAQLRRLSFHALVCIKLHKTGPSRQALSRKRERGQNLLHRLHPRHAPDCAVFALDFAHVPNLAEGALRGGVGVAHHA